MTRAPKRSLLQRHDPALHRAVLAPAPEVVAPRSCRATWGRSRSPRRPLQSAVVSVSGVPPPEICEAGAAARVVLLAEELERLHRDGVP